MTESSVVVEEWTRTSSRVSWKVCFRWGMLSWLTLTWQRRVTFVPLSTVLLGRTARPTVSMMYTAGPHITQTHNHAHALERNNIRGTACLIYIKPTSETEPVITQQLGSIILCTIKVKSEGRHSLAAGLLQSKQELLKEGQSFNKQHLTLLAPCGRAVLIYSSSCSPSATTALCNLPQQLQSNQSTSSKNCC